VANLTQQQAFFAAHIQPWLAGMCEAVSVHPRARFYGAVARFTQGFAQVEAQGFDLLS